MIGAKTVTSTFLLTASATLAWVSGLLSPDRLERLDVSAAFWVGFFACSAGILVARFWHLHDRSGFYFRYSSDPMQWEGEAHFVGTAGHRITIGENTGDAYDFPPPVQLSIYIGMAYMIGLLAFSGRAIDLLGEFPETIALAASQYCPDTETQGEQDDMNAPGCALVRRAYELGYATSLGDCEGKARVADLEICTLRQRDEPALHYAWRLLESFYTSLSTKANDAYFMRLEESFRKKIDHLDTLYQAQRQVIGAKPRASHNLWTNLPHPHGGFAELTVGVFERGRCVEQFQRLPHQPELSGAQLKSASAVVSSVWLEHIVGQLLFDPRYVPAAGYCREYIVHWGAPLDACSQLVANPEAFLQTTGAFDGVMQVIRRHDLTKELEALHASIPDDSGPRPSRSVTSIPTQRFVSFHCYIEEPRHRAERSSQEFTLAGRSFAADEIRVRSNNTSATVYVDRYRHVASLLAKGFHYGRLLSEASIDVGTQDASIEAFSGREFYLTKLDLLANMDIYLGHEWLQARPDLLEMYPYHLHLQNYVDVFRVQYTRERGRL